MACGGQTSAAVVARADGDDHALAAEVAVELRTDELGKVGSGLLHQLEDVDAEFVDREPIDLGI